MLTLRVAAPHDLDFYKRAFVELAVDDPMPSKEKWSRELEPHTVIAEIEGNPVGYVFSQAFGSVGYLKQIVTIPDARRKGVGRALMLSVAEKLKALSCTEWALNVKANNTPAKALYTKLGMRLSYPSAVLQLEWSRALSLPTTSLVAVVPGPSDDRVIEQTFKLLDGFVAERRELGRVLRSVVDGDQHVGLAVFDPTFPGSFPFQAGSIAIAGTLLRALYEERQPESQFINLVVERDTALIDALIAHGAEERIRLENWRGNLPPDTSALIA